MLGGYTSMHKLILLRHGESTWNKDNRSASLNAENAAYVWGDAALNAELEAAILLDISEAREVLLVEIERRPYRDEIQASLRLMTIGKAL